MGLACVEASKIAGASEILAIDTNREKGRLALAFGATQFLCPDDYAFNIIEVVTQMASPGAARKAEAALLSLHSNCAPAFQDVFG